MCDPYFESKMIRSRVGSRPLEHVFSRRIINLRPPYTVKASHCLKCGIPLTHDQMFPLGRMPRYMCHSCYLQAVNANPNICLHCGNYLPRHQVGMSQREPRELKHAFCDECRDYHFYLAGEILGLGSSPQYGYVDNANPPSHVQPSISHYGYDHGYSLPHPEHTPALKQDIFSSVNQLRNQLPQPIHSPQPVSRSGQSDFVDAEYYVIEEDARPRKKKTPKYLTLGRKR